MHRSVLHSKSFQRYFLTYAAIFAAMIFISILLLARTTNNERARAAEQLNIAAILCWLGDYLAGAERRTLQSCPEAMQLAAAWQAALFAPLPQTAQRPQPVQSRPVRRAPVVENKRWQSILAVLATV